MDDALKHLDVSLFGMVAVVVVLAAAAYPLLLVLQGSSQWIAWGAMMGLVAVLAGVIVVYRERGD